MRPRQWRPGSPLPLIIDGAFGYKAVNVADQTEDVDSFLNWMKELIGLRRRCPEWGGGSCHVLDSGEPTVFMHGVEWKGRRLIAAHNLPEKTAAVRLEKEPDSRLTRLWSSRRRDASPESLKIDLEPYGYRWYCVESAVGEGSLQKTQ
jgi:maltose alpha-D-glucosyltransferase/alpha-amylase